jgi:hypothetical protein
MADLQAPKGDREAEVSDRKTSPLTTEDLQHLIQINLQIADGGH